MKETDMSNDNQTRNRLLAAGIPRKAADDPDPARLTKLFKAPDEEAASVPQIKPVKVSPAQWVPPKVAASEDPRTDNAERYLAELASARAKARAKATGGG